MVGNQGVDCAGENWLKFWLEKWLEIQFRFCYMCKLLLFWHFCSVGTLGPQLVLFQAKTKAKIASIESGPIFVDLRA